MTKPRDLAILGGGFTQTGAGAVQRQVEEKLKDIVSVKDFGAVGDGITNDTAALVAAAAALQNGQQLDFGGGTYLISYQGAAYSSVYGNVVMDFLSKSDIALVGTGATIKVVNHNITTNGGLRFANFKSCKRVRIAGLNFDMTFTGVNTSASYYPFCGAITAIDSEAAGQAQTALNGDFLIEDCTFKLYHPWGCWATSGNPYLGDPNNGFKIESVLAYGPYLATAYDEQCRNITVRRCIWKNGHNGYGPWVWAWNNATVENCTAESWVTKYSNSSGVIQGGGVPFVRYHQWHCSGMFVRGNYFKAKPCDQRTTSGFEGRAEFANLVTNLTGDYKHGSTITEGNTIILGNGDNANTIADNGIQINLFGTVAINSNTFDGIATTTNASSGVSRCIWYSQSADSGFGSLTIDGNTFGYNLSYSDNILCDTGSNTSAASRRCKQLTVSNNTSKSQRYYFLITGTGQTYQGAIQTTVSGNVIDGENNTVADSSNANSIAIYYGNNVASDMVVTSGNSIRYKNTGVYTISSNPNFQTYGNEFSGVTAATNTARTSNIAFPTGGIRFPTNALSTASTDVNTLDWYEEGTFTPVYTPASGSFTSITASNTGKYVRIGKTVYFWIATRTTAATTLGTASGTLYLTGLPFVPSSDNGFGVVGLIQQWNLGTSVIGVQAIVEGGQSRLYLSKNASNASAAYVQATELLTSAGSFNNLLGIAGMYQLTN